MIDFGYPWKAHIVDQPGAIQVVVSDRNNNGVSLMEFDDVDTMMITLMRFSKNELVIDQHGLLREMLEEGSHIKWQFIEANDRINLHATATVLLREGYSVHEITQLTGITGDRIHEYKSRMKKKESTT